MDVTYKHFLCLSIVIPLLLFSSSVSGQNPHPTSVTIKVYEVTKEITEVYVRTSNQTHRVPFVIAVDLLVIGSDHRKTKIDGEPISLVGTQFRVNVLETSRQVYVPAASLTKVAPYSDKAMQAMTAERNALRKALRQLDDEIMAREQLEVEAGTSDIPRIVQHQRKPLLNDSWLRIQQSKAHKPPISEPYFAEALLWSSLGNHEDALLNFITGSNIAAQTGRTVLDDAEYYQDIVKYLNAYVKVPRSGKEAANDPQHDDQKTARKLFASGVSAFRLCKFKEGARLFTESLLLHPTKPASWYYRAMCFKHLKMELRAQHDAVIGASLEKHSHGKGVYWALSPAQGEVRMWLEGFRHRKNIPVLARDH